MATSSRAKKRTVRIASGRKRARQNVKLNAANTALRSRFRTVIKNVQKAVAAGDKTKAGELFRHAQSVIDAVADKGIFHKNKAARHKSRLAAKVKALATAAAGAAPSSTTRPLSRAKFITKAQAIGSIALQRLADDHALDAVDHARHAQRRVADVRAGAGARTAGAKRRHHAAQPLGPVARAEDTPVAGHALDEDLAGFDGRGHR